jgi:phage anti-repressor protein
MANFTVEIAKNTLKENREYPINFDHLIEWCGLTNSQRARHYLINNFTVDLDYTQLAISVSIPNSLYLRVDASKEFASTCKTEEGRNYRQTFINAERELGIYSQAFMSDQYKETIKGYSIDINDLKNQLTEVKQIVQILNQRVNNLTESSKPKQEIKVNENKINGFTARENLNSLVNQYVYIHQTKDKDGYRKAWNELYFYFKNETGIDLKRRVSTAKCKPGQPKITSGVEYAEQYRLIDLLYELAKEILL